MLRTVPLQVRRSILKTRDRAEDFRFTVKEPKIKSIALKKAAFSIPSFPIFVLLSTLIFSPPTLEGAIVLADDFETGANNINSPGPPINGQWITTPNLSGWTLSGTMDVAGTDFYSSPDSTYNPPHSGHIAAAFFSAGNSGATPTRPFPPSMDTASIQKTVSTTEPLPIQT